jgi:hypothetical protein
MDFELLTFLTSCKHLQERIYLHEYLATITSMLFSFTWFNQAGSAVEKYKSASILWKWERVKISNTLVFFASIIQLQIDVDTLKYFEFYRRL